MTLKFKILFCIALVCAFACSKNQEVENKAEALSTAKSSLTLEIGKSSKISVTIRWSSGDFEVYNPSSSTLKLEFTSSDSEVATVDASGTVKALKKGTATIGASCPDNPLLSCKVTVTVKSPGVSYDLSAPWNDNMAYYYIYEAGMDSQCFDFDSKGNIYFACTKNKGQVGYLTIRKFSPDKKLIAEMPLYYMGHGTAFSVEEDGNDVYIWVSGCGTVNSDKRGYGSSRVGARVKFEPGVGKAPEDFASDCFYINGKTSLDVSVDRVSGNVAILATGGSKAEVFIYSKKAIFDAPLKSTSFTVSRGSMKTGEVTDAKSTSVTLKLHDLTGVTPIASFSVAKPDAFGKRADGSGNKSNQGFCFYDDSCYFLGDYDRNNRDVNLTRVKTDGTIVHSATHIKAVDDAQNLIRTGVGVDTGYYESEGLQFLDDTLYVGFLCWDAGGCKNSILKLQ